MSFCTDIVKQWYFILNAWTRSCVFHLCWFDCGHGPSNTEQWTNRGDGGEEPAVAGRATAEPNTPGS